MAISSKRLLSGAALLLAMAAGYGLGVGHQTATPLATPPASASVGARKILYYRNPMGLADTSPTPKQDSMGMEYVPVYEDEVLESPGTVRLSAERVQRLGVRTEAATRRAISPSVRVVGTVQVNETRQTILSPRFEGWVVTLHAAATGMTVKKGDVLLDVYSPEISQIETEYLSVAPDAPKAVRQGALERLATLAVPEDEIQRLQHDRQIKPTFALRAGADATVLEKQAIEGMRFAPGDQLYRLADLSTVWFVADVYEQDLAHVFVGQIAQLNLPALPQAHLKGRVDFIYPTINPATRTAKIRIELENTSGLLRPEMYGSAELSSVEGAPVLSVPQSAVLTSGEAQIVFVARGSGLFQPVKVATGTSGAGYVEIVEGLSEGDNVVTSSSFLIDAESNIRAALQNFTAPETQP